MKLHYTRKLLIATAVALSMGMGLAGCAGTGTSGGAQVAASQQAIKLTPRNWDSFNREQLDNFIAAYGNASASYNPGKRPYVVFDWDNTSIFLDIEEAALIYQLENLVFGATPAQLDKAIRMNIADKSFAKGFNNAAGEAVNIDKVAPDIIESYTWLYNNYQGLKGGKSLEEVKKSPHYMNFITKVRYLYEAIGDTFDHAVSYPWVTYLFTGMTEAQVRKLTRDTVAWQLKQPVESVKWTSPASQPGKAGVLSISWKNGLRLLPEMQELYDVLRKSGFDVYVCSASFIDVIKEISSNPEYGYRNPENMAYAMELERDANGRLMTEFRKGYDQTQGKGKTKTIERFLVSRYGYGPLMIAGDSEGDQNMMGDFADTKIVLIVNRLRSPKTDIGKFSKLAVESYGKPGAKFLLQGRDDNKGVLVPSQLHYKLGAKEGQALR
ncbi:MAG: haloacid dehalogenase-like hydrolase [Candidatus Accumulibacter sp.]|jgi:phosphoserine phosphatase|nr:haloacid dehalogenase-like hydrolase [Accumulibacter sp.]